jgi:urease accessory protein
MMLLIRAIVGNAHEARFAGRRVDRFLVSSTDASKRRLRGRTDAGIDVAILLEPGAYLAEGAVLDDDGERVVAVERKPEEALIIRLSSVLDRSELVRQAVRLGHAFGNQHVPIEVEGGEIRVPITTSQEIAFRTVSALGLEGAEAALALVQLGRQRALHVYSHHLSPEGR